MKIVLDDNAIKNSGLTLNEFAYLFLYTNSLDVIEGAKSLKDKGLAFTSTEGLFDHKPTRTALSKYTNAVIAAEDNNLSSDEELADLAQKLKDIYPKGKKEGKWPWTEGPALIIRRLKIFEKKYGKYPAQDIIDATQKYVNDNFGSQEMRLLKYFIFKEAVGAGGDRESTSDLYTMLCNKEEDTQVENWAQTLF